MGLPRKKRMNRRVDSVLNASKLQLYCTGGSGTMRMSRSICTRDFTEMYRELYGLSYPGVLCPLPSEARVRSQGTRMAFSNIGGESVEGMKSN